MKHNLAAVFLLTLFVMTSAAKADEWQLVWSDEFDGDALDMNKWSYQLGDGSADGLTGWGNNEAEYYQEGNAVVKDGFLSLIAKEEKVKGYKYTSARLRTKGKGDWTYCRVEIRAKMPIGQGLWPALWMYPSESVYGGWAASGEIDMVEYLGHEPNKVHGTLHFGGKWPQNQHKGKSYTLKSGDFHSDFHLFAFEWEEGEMRWTVDGTLYQTQGKGDWWSSGGDFPAPFDQDFYLIMNLAVGGNWPGYPDATTQFPQELVIDYVRVYQRATDVQGRRDAVPNGYSLEQNSPNPFNPSTSIAFTLPETQEASLDIFDVQGRKIKSLVHDVLPAGNHAAAFDASGLSSGIYLYRLSTSRFLKVKRMLVLK